MTYQNFNNLISILGNTHVILYGILSYFFITIVQILYYTI